MITNYYIKVEVDGEGEYIDKISPRIPSWDRARGEAWRILKEGYETTEGTYSDSGERFIPPRRIHEVEVFSVSEET